MGKTGTKKVRKSISLGTKLVVLKRFERGERTVDIRKAMGLSISTIRTIFLNSERIRKMAERSTASSAGRITIARSDAFEEMEMLLSKWIENQNNHNCALSAAVVKDQARTIYKELTKHKSNVFKFTASEGWLTRFKKRFGFNSDYQCKDQLLFLKSADIDSMAKSHENEIVQLETKTKKVIKTNDFTSPKLEIECLQDCEFEFISSNAELDTNLAVEEQNNALLDTNLRLEKQNKAVLETNLPVEEQTKVFQHLEDIFAILEEKDPNKQRSTRVIEEVSQLFSCYKDMSTNRNNLTTTKASSKLHENDKSLFTVDEIMSLIEDITSSLSSCNSKMDQFNAIAKLAVKHLFSNIA